MWLLLAIINLPQPTYLQLRLRDVKIFSTLVLLCRTLMYLKPWIVFVTWKVSCHASECPWRESMHLTSVDRKQRQDMWAVPEMLLHNELSWNNTTFFKLIQQFLEVIHNINGQLKHLHFIFTYLYHRLYILHNCIYIGYIHLH